MTKIWQKMKKSIVQKLHMSCPLSHKGSIMEAGEFGPRILAQLTTILLLRNPQFYYVFSSSKSNNNKECRKQSADDISFIKLVGLLCCDKFTTIKNNYFLDTILRFHSSQAFPHVGTKKGTCMYVCKRIKK